jgi:5-methylcytosine-specific restriction protein B
MGQVREALAAILSEYGRARAEPFKQHPHAQRFEAIESVLSAALPPDLQASMHVSASRGNGNWAHVPWIAVLDSRETTSAQDGVYCVYLFRGDLSGVYLALGIGVTRLRRTLGPARAAETTKERLAAIVPYCKSLPGLGFAMPASIDLRSSGTLAKAYEKACAASKFYSSDQLPDDDELTRDLSAAVAAYARYIVAKPSQSLASGKPKTASLSDLVKEWKAATGFPTPENLEDEERRRDWARMLSSDRLDNMTPSEFRPLYSSGFYGSTGPMSSLNTFIRDADEAELGRLRKALRHVLYGEGDVGERLQEAIEPSGPYKIHGLGESVLMKCLAIVYPDRYLPAYVYAGEQGKKRMLELLGLLALSDELSKGRLAILSNDTLRSWLSPEFHESLVPNSLAMTGFLFWLLDQDKTRIEAPSETAEQRFLRATAWTSSQLADAIDLLEGKKQLVLYGPPGTGKTYVARELARYWAGAQKRVRSVQFHPSYGYEDFIEALRPTGENGQLRYEYRPGVLRRVAAEALEREGERFVLLIDELNRASLPRVFGELLQLLEYRREPVTLAGSGDSFALPDNLYFIATMNTADRSIGQMDIAMRRRFHFLPMRPDLELLERFLAARDIAPPLRGWITSGMKELNERIESSLGREFCIGHSLFMREELDEALVDLIWQHDIEPLLEDYFYERYSYVAELREAFFSLRHSEPAP